MHACMHSAFTHVRMRAHTQRRDRDRHTQRERQKQTLRKTETDTEWGEESFYNDSHILLKLEA